MELGQSKYMTRFVQGESAMNGWNHRTGASESQSYCWPAVENRARRPATSVGCIYKNAGLHQKGPEEGSTAWVGLVILTEEIGCMYQKLHSHVTDSQFLAQLSSAAACIPYLPSSYHQITRTIGSNWTWKKEEKKIPIRSHMTFAA